MDHRVLIRNAEVWGHGLADVQVENGRIAAIVQPGQLGHGDLDARGAALLPGLHDHHLHLAGLAARAASVPCGPPEVLDARGLAVRLTVPGSGWLRGIGYHESVMGLPHARVLDELAPHRPLRIQHRSGRMWLLNSLALEHLLARAAPPPGLQRDASGFTGHLFDEDQWLRTALGSMPPDFSHVSERLAAFGVTGVTDMSPRNDPGMAAHFAAQLATGALRQRATLAGTLELAEAEPRGWMLGPAKLHLHEAEMPDPDAAVAFVLAAHAQGRPVAIHCVSEVEMVFALATLAAAGPLPGDRIEHASIADPGHIAAMARLGLAVCVQPHFVSERGDAYLRDVEPHLRPHLYPLRSLEKAGLPIAGGSDAPFGGDSPWQAMAAAVSRRTSCGAVIGADEGLSPEQALALYLAAPGDLSQQRRIAVAEPADLCLLSQPWSKARENLAKVQVQATWVSGQLLHDPVNQTPV